MMQVIKKLGATIIGMGSHFVTFALKDKYAEVLRERIFLAIEGITCGYECRYFDYRRIKIRPGQPLAPVNFVK